MIFTARQHSSMLCRCPVLAIAKVSVRLSARHTLLSYQNTLWPLRRARRPRQQEQLGNRRSGQLTLILGIFLPRLASHLASLCEHMEVTKFCFGFILIPFAVRKAFSSSLVVCLQ